MTISFARHTVLIDDRERLDARRWETRVSREMSWREWDWEADGERDARLRSSGDVDIVQGWRRYQTHRCILDCHVEDRVGSLEIK